jgi:hypothetical protein
VQIQKRPRRAIVLGCWATGEQVHGGVVFGRLARGPMSISDYEKRNEP